MYGKVWLKKKPNQPKGSKQTSIDYSRLQKARREGGGGG